MAREFFILVRTLIAVKLLTALPLWSQICDHYFIELRVSLITFPNFVR